VLLEDVDDVADAVVDLLVELADLLQLGEGGTLVGIAGFLLFIGALQVLRDHQGSFWLSR
jgi:hypothetical protein